MQRYSALLLLVLPALLAAQGLRDKIREKCGAVRPQSCTCQDGSTFTAFRPGNRPCGGFEQVRCRQFIALCGEMIRLNVSVC